MREKEISLPCNAISCGDYTMASCSSTSSNWGGFEHLYSIRTSVQKPIRKTVPPMK
jgi:hypothetical protein